MPNPLGVNDLQPTPVQGAIKRLAELQRSAPMSGAALPSRALNTPRRSQRRAVRGRGEPMAPPPPVAAQVTPGQSKAQVWAELARHPDASPLVRELAQLANAS
jgi:hypothetical protein